MIKVDKNYAIIPDKLGAQAQKKREQLLAERSNHQAAGHYYADSSVKEQLRLIYHDKCGYCESAKSPAFSWRVDHFRPQKGRDKAECHLGYYWLTYEWSNLILSCERCNNAKSNHFPIQGDRITTPQANYLEWRADSKSLLNEKPLLLNPELDHPENHLIFFPDGSIQGRDERAKKASKSVN